MWNFIIVIQGHLPSLGDLRRFPFYFKSNLICNCNYYDAGAMFLSLLQLHTEEEVDTPQMHDKQSCVCRQQRVASQLWLQRLCEMTQIFPRRTTLWHHSPTATRWTVLTCCSWWPGCCSEIHILFLPVPAAGARTGAGCMVSAEAGHGLRSFEITDGLLPMLRDAARTAQCVCKQHRSLCSTQEKFSDAWRKVYYSFLPLSYLTW